MNLHIEGLSHVGMTSSSPVKLMKLIEYGLSWISDECEPAAPPLSLELFFFGYVDDSFDVEICF
jgi:hypothetical protein